MHVKGSKAPEAWHLLPCKYDFSQCALRRCIRSQAVIIRLQVTSDPLIAMVTDFFFLLLLFTSLYDHLFHKKKKKTILTKDCNLFKEHVWEFSSGKAFWQLQFKINYSITLSIWKLVIYGHHFIVWNKPCKEHFQSSVVKLMMR